MWMNRLFLLIFFWLISDQTSVDCFAIYPTQLITKHTSSSLFHHKKPLFQFYANKFTRMIRFVHENNNKDDIFDNLDEETITPVIDKDSEAQSINEVDAFTQQMKKISSLKGNQRKKKPKISSEEKQEFVEKASTLSLTDIYEEFYDPNKVSENLELTSNDEELIAQVEAEEVLRKVNFILFILFYLI